jgi:gamma-glutamylputrescine oxidase
MSNLLDMNDRPGAYPPSFYASGIFGLNDCAPVAGDVTCDVCVVGGGYTGLSTALHLAQRGYDVRLVEAQRIGFGASGRNGGQVGQGQRQDQFELEKMFGQTRARELWKIGTDAVELVRDLAQSDLIEADFHPGILHADHKANYSKHSRDYVDHLNDVYDYSHIRYVDDQEIRTLVNSPLYHSGTLDTRSGHIDPLQLSLGLGRIAQTAGAKLHENSRVIKFVSGNKPKIFTDKASITADYVVLACNGYIGGLHADVARRVMPINNYIAATEPLDPETQEQIISGNIAVADTKFVVNYFRFSDDHRMLFGGTETYRYRFPKDIAGNIKPIMSKVLPKLANTRIEYAWGGTLGITMNRLPHFQTYNGNVLSMSGFSGQGVALGTLSGQIAAETIAGQSERFDVMAKLNTPKFPGGRMMQHPILVLAMIWYGIRDRI